MTNTSSQYRPTWLALPVIMILVMSLTACGSRRPAPDRLDRDAINRAVDQAVVQRDMPVRDTRISTEFRDQGIRLFYTSSGELERIQVTGTAQAWRGNVDILAELDAMDKLVKFVHGQEVNSQRRVRMLTRSMDRAKDFDVQHLNSPATANYDSRDLERDPERQTYADISGLEREHATTHRAATRIEHTLTQAVTEITGRGRLTGVIKIDDRVINNGRVYQAGYEWSNRTQNASEYLRHRMR